MHCLKHPYSFWMIGFFWVIEHAWGKKIYIFAVLPQSNLWLIERNETYNICTNESSAIKSLHVMKRVLFFDCEAHFLSGSFNLLVGIMAGMWASLCLLNMCLVSRISEVFISNEASWAKQISIYVILAQLRVLLIFFLNIHSNNFNNVNKSYTIIKGFDFRDDSLFHASDLLWLNVSGHFMDSCIAWLQRHNRIAYFGELAWRSSKLENILCWEV